MDFARCAVQDAVCDALCVLCMTKVSCDQTYWCNPDALAPPPLASESARPAASSLQVMIPSTGIQRFQRFQPPPPGGAYVQRSFDTAPASEDVPLGHAVGADAPSAQYEPAGHWVGAEDPGGQKLPGGHSLEVVTEGQYRPAAQASHVTLPPHDTYDPSGHSVALHIPGASHLYPMGQSVWLVACGCGQ